MDLEEHLKRQIAFSRATFGPGERKEGVIDHIRKELVELEESGGDPDEWTDIVILALDGLTRCLQTRRKCTTDLAAQMAVIRIVSKQNANELREWPDWRTADPNRAIEHVRGQT